MAHKIYKIYQGDQVNYITKAGSNNSAIKAYINAKRKETPITAFKFWYLNEEGSIETEYFDIAEASNYIEI